MTTHAQRVFQPLPQISKFARIVQLGMIIHQGRSTMLEQAHGFAKTQRKAMSKHNIITVAAKCGDSPQNCRIAAWPQVANQS
jgi:hypothetical protein